MPAPVLTRSQFNALKAQELAVQQPAQEPAQPLAAPPAGIPVMTRSQFDAAKVQEQRTVPPGLQKLFGEAPVQPAPQLVMGGISKDPAFNRPATVMGAMGEFGAGLGRGAVDFAAGTVAAPLATAGQAAQYALDIAYSPEIDAALRKQGLDPASVRRDLPMYRPPMAPQMQLGPGNGVIIPEQMQAGQTLQNAAQKSIAQSQFDIQQRMAESGKAYQQASAATLPIMPANVVADAYQAAVKAGEKAFPESQDIKTADITQNPGTMKDPRYWAANLGEQVSNVAGTILTGAAGKAAGLSRSAVMGSMGTLAGIQEGMGVYREALDSGATPEEAFYRFANTAPVSAALNTFGFDQLLRRLPEGVRGQFYRNLVKRFGVIAGRGAVETGTEMAEEVQQGIEMGQSAGDVLSQAINVAPIAGVMSLLMQAIPGFDPKLSAPKSTMGAVRVREQGQQVQVDGSPAQTHTFAPVVGPPEGMPDLQFDRPFDVGSAVGQQLFGQREQAQPDPITPEEEIAPTQTVSAPANIDIALDQNGTPSARAERERMLAETVESQPDMAPRMHRWIFGTEPDDELYVTEPAALPVTVGEGLRHAENSDVYQAALAAQQAGEAYLPDRFSKHAWYDTRSGQIHYAPTATAAEILEEHLHSIFEHGNTLTPGETRAIRMRRDKEGLTWFDRDDVGKRSWTEQVISDAIKRFQTQTQPTGLADRALWKIGQWWRSFTDRVAETMGWERGRLTPEDVYDRIFRGHGQRRRSQRDMRPSSAPFEPGAAAGQRAAVRPQEALQRENEAWARSQGMDLKTELYPVLTDQQVWEQRMQEQRDQQIRATAERPVVDRPVPAQAPARLQYPVPNREQRADTQRMFDRDARRRELNAGLPEGSVKPYRASVRYNGVDLETTGPFNTGSANRPRMVTGNALNVPTTEDGVRAFAGDVQRIVDRAPESASFGDRKVFIGDIYAEYNKQNPMPREVFNSLMIDAQKRGMLTMSRADLVQAMDPEQVRESEIRHLNGEFNFVTRDGFQRDADQRASVRREFPHYRWEQSALSAGQRRKALGSMRRTFGLTKDVREAGYILPDGKMLDFSGRHEGAADQDVRGARSVDHSQVTDAGVYDWMEAMDAGAVRVDATTGIINFSQPLTPAQRAVIERATEESSGLQIEVTSPKTQNRVYYADLPNDPRLLRRALNEANRVIAGEMAATEWSEPDTTRASARVAPSAAAKGGLDRTGEVVDNEPVGARGSLPSPVNLERSRTSPMGTPEGKETAPTLADYSRASIRRYKELGTGVMPLSPKSGIRDRIYSAPDMQSDPFFSVARRLSSELHDIEVLFGELPFPKYEITGVVGGEKVTLVSADPKDIYRHARNGVRSKAWQQILDASIDPEKLAKKLKIRGDWRKDFYSLVKVMRTPGFLASNDKAGFSFDEGLFTCDPDASCAECYVPGTHFRKAIRVAQVRRALMVLADPEGTARLVANEVKKIKIDDLPIFRIHGAGDVTSEEQIRFLNELAKNMDRGLHIFSRRHDVLRELEGSSDAPWYKMGSIDIDLYRQYGLDFLEENMNYGIANCFLYTDFSEIPAMLAVHRSGALPLVFPASGKLYRELRSIANSPARVRSIIEESDDATKKRLEGLTDDELKRMVTELADSSCPCDAKDRPVPLSCRQCSLSNAGCFMSFADKFVNSKGDVVPSDSVDAVQPMMAGLTPDTITKAWRRTGMALIEKNIQSTKDAIKKFTDPSAVDKPSSIPLKDIRLFGYSPEIGRTTNPDVAAAWVKYLEQAKGKAQNGFMYFAGKEVIPARAMVEGKWAKPRDLESIRERIRQEGQQVLREAEGDTTRASVRSGERGGAGDETDAAYLAAVERGDMKTAQRMVDEAAKKAGYNVEAWHGSKQWGFTVFDTSQEGGAHFGTLTQAEMRAGKGRARKFFLRMEHPTRTRDKRQFKKIRSGKDSVVYLNRYEGISVETVTSIPSSILDAISDSKFRSMVKEARDSFIVKNAWQIKSADPVTYDDAGNVIPLSQRFNPESGDIRSSVRVRPDLAQPASDAAQPVVDQADQERLDQGRPAPRADKDVEADAAAISDAEIEAALAAGGQLNDAQTMAARRFLDTVAVQALSSGNAAELRRAVDIADQYRESGSEQARAFRQRRDVLNLTQQQRAVRAIADALLAPTKKRKKTLDNITATLRERATSTREATQLRGARRQQLNEHAQDVVKWTRKLQRLGVDMNNIEQELADPYRAAWILREVSAMRSDYWDAAYEWWQNAILSGPLTHVANITGNTMSAAWEFTVQRPVEALVNLAAKDPDAADVDELRYILGGMRPGFARAFRNLIASFRMERSAFADEMGSQQNTFKDVVDSGPAIGGAKGRIIRAPGYRALTAMDDFYKSLLAQMQVGAEAYRIAKAEGAQDIPARVQELVADTGSKAWDRAIDLALELTFQKPGGKALAVGSQIKEIPGMRYIVPFLKTPLRLLGTGLRKGTPFGALRFGYKLATDKAYTRPRKVRDAAEAFIGLTITAGLAAMLGDDDEPWITGSAPYNLLRKGEREARQRTAPPLSIRIGDRWLSYARIEPLATGLATTIDLVRAWQGAERAQDALSASGQVAGYFLAQLKNKTFLRGLSDVMSMVDDPTSVTDWAANFGASWVPNIIRQPMRAADPAVRETGTGDGWDRFAQRLRYGIAPAPATAPPAKVDLWGQPIRKAETGTAATDFLYRLLSPVQMIDLGDRDPRAVELDRLLVNWNNQHPGDTWWPTTPNRYYTQDGKTVYYTPEQYESYARTAGEEALRMLRTKTLNIDTPTKRDVDIIQRAIENAREKAKAKALR